jgi:hypothetical protein
MPNSPRKLAKAARLTVVPCDLQDRFHVVGDTAHYVVLVFGDKISCNCSASAFGAECSHMLAVKWARQKQEVQSG